MTREPRSTIAWERGAKGEEIVGALLEARAEPRFCVLHDRGVPGSKANIDHLVVTQAGVFVIDAKRYRGRVERRQGKLLVNGRDRTSLVDKLRWQRDTVGKILTTKGLPAVRVRPWLCFSGADWPFVASPLVFDDVGVVWAKGLVGMIEQAQITAWTDVRATTEALASALRER